ncbi:methylmalonyl-CoA decarboxylase [Paraburkholderia humisilvae]|uniref:Methylmalonyl-CoA decarboxylase n=1 Tax=Paraburkholderia humisilvae TaxID=627669 RepID=A0A6J5F475_9BURK|nr:methylmalonyl-CoA decarboxylase [Paraburkholderia humisilvae]CAB3773650.1 Methylmalonyl-CoA decarboxylase [Paraburkholderia humisilvae]
MECIKVQTEDKIGTIALDSDAKRNALSKPLINECIGAFELFRAEGVRAVVLRSSTAQKIWSAGHDIDERRRSNAALLPFDDSLEVLLRAVSDFPAPVIAMVQGSVWGGACELVMTCDMVFGDDTCAFAISPTKLGLPYSTASALHVLNRLPLNIVMEMFCCAQPISAQRALRVGLVNDLLPANDLESHVFDMARLISMRSPTVISSFKAMARTIAKSAGMHLGIFDRIHELRRQLYLGADCGEAVRALVNKRNIKH